MAQPVIDTLEVADTLQRAGMEREQAEGIARTLGTQLGEHVAVSKDLDVGFSQMRAHIDERIAHIDQRFAQERAHVDERFAQERAHVDERFAQERAHVDKRFASVDERLGRIDERFKALDGKLNVFGVVAGLALAFLGVLATLDRFV